MITKRIAISFLTVVGVLALVAALAVALLSDSATLANNSLEVGTANLKIAQVTSPCGTFSDSINPGIQAINLAPGDSATKDFCLKNVSEADISLDVTVGSVSFNSGDLDQTLVGLSVECESEGSVNVGTVAAPNTSALITTLAHNQEKQCTITATLSVNADNDDASDTLNFDVVFTGTQTD